MFGFERCFAHFSPNSPKNKGVRDDMKLGIEGKPSGFISPYFSIKRR